jgi:hypothetical protein
MKMNEAEVRFRLTLEWPAMPPSNDPTEDNPHSVRQQFIHWLWNNYYLDDEEWGDEGAFDSTKTEFSDGSLTVVLKSSMPEAMGEVMNHFTMEMSYYYPVGTKCTFEKVGS